MSDDLAPGAECFRSPEEYAEADRVQEALDSDIIEAQERLEAERDDIDPARLMEDLAVTAFGGDLRDSAGWRSAAMGGDMPRAWTEAVEKQTR